MKHPANARALILTVLVLLWLNACSRSFVGLRFQMIGQPDQQTMRFDCREATRSRQCNVFILANPNGTPTKHAVSVGQSKVLPNAPLGATYCVSAVAINWSDCTAKYTLGAGTTTVESGRLER